MLHVAMHDCQARQNRRMNRNPKVRLLWKDKTSPCTMSWQALVMSWQALVMSKSVMTEIYLLTKLLTEHFLE